MAALRMATYQLSWRIEPGLRGLGCSGFRALPTEVPDNDRGVALDLADDAESGALIAHLEEHFAPQRFSNNAAAFEAVKSYVLAWAAKRT
jgi:hypothetical protein